MPSGMSGRMPGIEHDGGCRIGVMSLAAQVQELTHLWGAGSLSLEGRISLTVAVYSLTCYHISPFLCTSPKVMYLK